MDKQAITIRQLREMLFHLDNQKMTVEDLRSMLFQEDEQDKPNEINFSMWKKLEAKFKKGQPRATPKFNRR